MSTPTGAGSLANGAPGALGLAIAREIQERLRPARLILLGSRATGDQRTPAPASLGGLPEGWGRHAGPRQPGRKPRNSVPEDVIAATVILNSEKYAGFNHSHLTAVPGEREGIHLSRQTVSRLLNRYGLSSTRQHRPPKHRVRRERMSQEGMLL